MDIIDRVASIGLRLGAGRFAVFSNGLGDGDLAGLVEKIPRSDGCHPVDRSGLE